MNTITRVLALLAVLSSGCALAHVAPLPDAGAGGGCRTPSAPGVTRQIGNWPEDDGSRCVCRDLTDAGWLCRAWDES